MTGIAVILKSTLSVGVVVRIAHILFQCIGDTRTVVIGDTESDVGITRTPFCFVVAVFLSEGVSIAFGEGRIRHPVVAVRGIVIPVAIEGVASDIIVTRVRTDILNRSNVTGGSTLCYFEIINCRTIYCQILLCGSTDIQTFPSDCAGTCIDGINLAGFENRRIVFCYEE